MQIAGQGYVLREAHALSGWGPGSALAAAQQPDQQSEQAAATARAPGMGAVAMVTQAAAAIAVRTSRSPVMTHVLLLAAVTGCRHRDFRFPT